MYRPKPDWLRVRFTAGSDMCCVEEILNRLSLHTVCEEANCPNRGECFGRKTATFMILGRVCTRNCTFCNVEKGKPQLPDPQEPCRIAQAVKELQLKHVVITSVTRDDLPDGGAGHFSEVVREIKKMDSTVIVEVLIPDFLGNTVSIRKVVEAGPEIINHNVETVPRLYAEVRPMAVYERSLKLLADVKAMSPGTLTKSGIMVGLGEKKDEVIDVFKDLRKAGCELLTVGQYLAPSAKHYPVVEYVHPDVFEEYRKAAMDMGFKFVASAPLVRSSYHADKMV